MCGPRVGGLSGASRGAALDQRQPDVAIAVGKVSGRCIHHVTGEPAVAGARFHDVEGRAAPRLQHRPHLGQLHRNGLAEQRTDVDAREEVAVASRSSLSAV